MRTKRSSKGIVERATLTVAEVAQLLGCSTDLIYESVRRGTIPAIRLGGRRVLVPRPALLRLLGAQDDGAFDTESLANARQRS